jgi:hypothetical protein
MSSRLDRRIVWYHVLPSIIVRKHDWSVAMFKRPIKNEDYEHVGCCGDYLLISLCLRELVVSISMRIRTLHPLVDSLSVVSIRSFVCYSSSTRRLGMHQCYSYC